ncbi:MAG: MnhB domain-containing protein [Thermosphaera sp.]
MEAREVGRRMIILFVILAVSLLIALAISYMELVEPVKELKPLGLFYIENSYFGNYSSKSPEAVTAIVWDYRGLDTIYESAVFFLAIVGGLSIFRLTREPPKEGKPLGLTRISRNGTKIVALLIISVSASIALHGHLTPGGGFQGGSTLAVASILLIPTFSITRLLSAGVTSTRLVIARSTAMTCIGLTAVLPVIRGLELVTNTSLYPAEVGGVLLSGSLFFYNLFEYLAVGSGFTAVFLYLSTFEHVYKEEIREEVVA